MNWRERFGSQQRGSGGAEVADTETVTLLLMGWREIYLEQCKSVKGYFEIVNFIN